MIHFIIRTVLLLALIAGQAGAAEIKNDVANYDLDGNLVEHSLWYVVPQISIKGNIELGDAQKFEARLAWILQIVTRDGFVSPASLPGIPWIVVRINSPGGDLEEAMKIGVIVHEKSMYTEVRPMEMAASAAVFIFTAGARRTVMDGGRLGLHRPHFPAEQFYNLDMDKARAKYGHMVSTIRDYWRSVGANDSTFSLMMSVDSDAVKWLSANESRALGLDGVDQVFREREIAFHRMMAPD